MTESAPFHQHTVAVNQALVLASVRQHELTEEAMNALEVLNEHTTNLINSIDLATLSLGTDLQIQWFTPATMAILDLSPADIGRPIAEIPHKLIDPDLVRDVRSVLHSVGVVPKRLRVKDGQSWMRQIRPHRTKNDVVTGVVITYINITAAQVSDELLRRLTAVLADSSDAITMLDFSGQITSWNRSAERLYGYTDAEALNLNISKLIPRGLKEEEFRLLRNAKQGNFVAPRETIRIDKDGNHLDVWITTTTLVDETGAPISVATTEHDLSESKAVARIKHLATHDQLTGLASRLLLEDLAARAFAHAKGTGTKVALLFIDLDQFKTVNDTRGHQIGDTVLQTVAKRVRSCISGQDSIVRQGGDEFILLLSGMNTVQAVSKAAEHILTSVSRPYKIQEEEMQSTVSIGISLFPDDASSLERLVRNADAAMYLAKARGPGTYSYFTAETATSVWDRNSLEYGLSRALDRREFALLYQPQVEIASGTIIGAEALLRWHHPELGLIKPDNFVAVAEETGLIIALGEWVMKTACTQVQAWHRAGLPALRIAVNLSAVQIGQLDFAATVARVLTEAQLDPNYLELEITESALMPNIGANLIRLQQLRKMGVRLALDDFGTGYSSLSYLAQLPINRLKMDVSFVRALTSDPTGNILVKGILSIAKSLNLRVIAEGVETLEQLELLQTEGCNEMQGYYFSPPVTADELGLMLEQGVGLQRSQ